MTPTTTVIQRTIDNQKITTGTFTIKTTPQTQLNLNLNIVNEWSQH